MSEPARLLTIAFSHYCEKARWALEHTGHPYREEAHVPILHWAPTLRAGGNRTVPVLLVEGREPLVDSTDILRYLDEQAPGDRKLYPADPDARRDADDLEELFDEKLGPHTRRMMYFHLLPDRALSVRLFQGGVSSFEGRLAKALFPALRMAIRRGLKVDAAGAERSTARVEETFEAVAKRLADGRRYLMGDTFGAADLTFASLAAPCLLPAEYGVPLPPMSDLPRAAIDIVTRLRDTPAGRFGLRVYAERRRARA